MKANKIQTWNEGRLSVVYERIPGEPRTKDAPGTEDRIEIYGLMVDGDDIGDIGGVLEQSGIDVFEALERLVLEGTAR